MERPIKDEKRELIEESGCSGFGDLLWKWLMEDPLVTEVVDRRSRHWMFGDRTGKEGK